MRALFRRWSAGEREKPSEKAVIEWNFPRIPLARARRPNGVPQTTHFANGYYVFIIFPLAARAPSNGELIIDCRRIIGSENASMFIVCLQSMEQKQNVSVCRRNRFVILRPHVKR